MHRNRGIIAEFGREVIKTVAGHLFLTAYAEEPNTGGTPDDKGGAGEDPAKSGGQTINYEDLIAKARQEEKQKQYKAIEKLKTQVTTLTEQHNNDLLKIAELEGKLKEAETKLTTAGKGDSEEVATLKKEVEALKGEKTNLEKKVTDLEKNKPASREEIEAQVRQELEAEYEVKSYKAEQLAAHKDEILVPEMVGGDTKEAIDQSITAAIARSNEIRTTLGVPVNGGKTTPQKKAPKTPPANPGIGSVQNTGVDLNRLATVDVASPEYAEMRKKLGLL